MWLKTTEMYSHSSGGQTSKISIAGPESLPPSRVSKGESSPLFGPLSAVYTELKPALLVP